MEKLNIIKNKIEYNNTQINTYYRENPILKFEVWNNVGVYYTPKRITNLFVKFILRESKITSYNNVKILDLFAGDGRLGYSISKNIPQKSINKITYIEIRKNTISKRLLNGHSYVIFDNGFNYKPSEKYNLVVSNPPYLSLNSNQAELMGFSWELAKKNCRNLYGIAISKGLELCEPNGILAVIAPFGYLRGINGAEFRQEIENQCSKVIINASNDRTLFEGVNQDIAFQLFIKRNENNKDRTKWKFAYNGQRPFKSIHVNLPFSTLTAEKYVRVGPIVWNRKKDYLINQAKNNIAIIYGGNISRNGDLKIPHNSYLNKQYILKKGTIPTDLISVPFIAIRRTMRGYPGAWKIDLSLVNDNNQIFTAENHVIIIELPQFDMDKLIEITNAIKYKIKKFYFHCGSPNISTKIVCDLFSKIITKYIQ